MVDESMGSLDAARRRAMLTLHDLWIRYIALGGLATYSELKGYLAGTARPTNLDHDLVAQALNERFTEMDIDSPMPYSHP